MSTHYTLPSKSEATTRRIVGVSLAAAAVNGLLSGGNVDRAIVARPAWIHLGLVPWAEYSRKADLGNGQWFYPAMALGGTLLSVLAAVLFLSGGKGFKRSAWPVFLAAGLMVLCLPISFEATPFIQSLRDIENQNLADLGRAFAGSFFWGRFQMLLHVAGFFANLWAVVSLCWHRNDQV